MKLKIPTKEVEVCDHCQRDGVLQTCLVCGKRFCLLCDCYLPGCMVQPDVCKVCDDRKDVQDISARWGLKLHALTKKRDAALKALAANVQL